MDCQDYDDTLHNLLGVFGPAGVKQLDGLTWLIYKMPDGSWKDLPTPQAMTDDQRCATIDALVVHLGIIANRRLDRQRLRRTRRDP